MKFLWIVKEFPPNIGGIQKYAFNYFANMPKKSCVLLTQRYEKNYEVIQIDNYLRENLQKVYRIANLPDNLNISSIFLHPLKLFKFYLQINRIVIKESVSHIVLCHPTFYYFALLLPLKLWPSIPVYCIFHGEDIPTFKMKSNKLFRFLLMQLDGYICNSHFTFDRLKKNVRGCPKIRIAFPGVEEKYFKPLNRIECRHNFGVTEKKVLYTIGRLDERKGHDLVINCLPEIIKEFKNVVYLIGGKGDYLSNLVQLVNKLNLQEYVKFLGFIEEEKAASFHHAGDIFVMPNRMLADGDSEGFGIVFLEAAAVGNPSIGGRSGGTADAIEDGVSGYLINPDDKEDFIDKVILLMKSKEHSLKMGKEGRDRALKNYTWPKLAEKLYVNLMEMIK